jgi:hypothetical protein
MRKELKKLLFWLSVALIVSNIILFLVLIL